MERNVVNTNVVNTSVSLEDKEGMIVDSAGDLSDGFVFGVIKQGSPAGEASVIQTLGECKAYVSGDESITQDAGLVASNSGYLVLAADTDIGIRAYAKEAYTATAAPTLIQIILT
jgi:hypothetical protein